MMDGSSCLQTLILLLEGYDLQSYTPGPRICIYTFGETSDFGTHVFGLSDIGNLSSLATVCGVCYLTIDRSREGRLILPSEATSYPLFQTAMSWA